MFDSTISVSSDLELCSKRLEFELTYSTLNLDGGLKEKEELLDSCTDNCCKFCKETLYSA